MGHGLSGFSRIKQREDLGGLEDRGKLKLLYYEAKGEVFSDKLC
jgi:hypothetical protein